MSADTLHMLSIAALVVGACCAAIVLLDVARHPQPMAVMNVVWPVTALFSTVFTLWAYFRYGRPSVKAGHGSEPAAEGEGFAAAVGKGALHCGAGCTIGDIVAEWLAWLVPSVAVAFGWGSLFADRMFAVWTLDVVLAFLIGIVFQYFAIVPMRHLGLAEGIVAAIKADALSLASWQIGMVGFMALAQLLWFPHVLGARADVASVEFWFAMQLAMVAGFVTAYPVNWWLIRAGIKEAM